MDFVCQNHGCATQRNVLILQRALDAHPGVSKSHDFRPKALDARDPKFRIVRYPLGSVPIVDHIRELPTIIPSLTMLEFESFLSTLLAAFRGARHFALVENSPSSTQARV